MRAAALASILLAALPPASAQELRFRTLTTADGLSDNAITCLFEDRDGFIWAGTERGLDRFDGNLTVPVPGISGPISAIAQDRQGRLWAGTLGQGLWRLDAQGAHRIPTTGDGPRALPPDRVHALLTLDDGTILVAGSPVAVSFLDPERGTLTAWDPKGPDGRPLLEEGSTSGQWCHWAARVDSSRLWLGLLHGGLCPVMGMRDRSVTHVLGPGPGAEVNATTSRATVLDGILYSGGWQRGIERHDLRTWEVLPPLPTDDETADLCVWEGRLVVAEKRSGLLLIDPRTGARNVLRRTGGPALHHTADGLPSDQVHCLLADRHGRLWAGTAAGLALHAPGAWRMHPRPLVPDGADDVELHDLTTMPDGTILALTGSGLIEVAPTAAAPQIHAFPGLVPTRLSSARNGVRLLGTETGLMRVDARSLAPITPLRRGMGSKDLGGTDRQYQVRGTFPDTLDGQAVWVVGALGYGISTYRDRDGQMTRTWPDSASTSPMDRFLVRDLRRDRNGRYWAATDGGILRLTLHDGSLKVFDRADGIPLARARAVLPVGDSVLAVLREGVLVSITGDAVRIHRPPARTGNFLRLAQDRAGRCWVTTDEGLERFDPQTGGWLHVPVCAHAGAEGIHGPITVLPGGQVALACGHELVTFDPAAFDSLRPLPLPYLVEAIHAGRPADLRGDVLELGYREGVLDVRVSALSPGTPQPLVFRVRLEGVENDWRTTSAKDLIRYAGLPAGTHRLLVQVRDAYGREGPVRALLTVHISGPFWQRWWFYAAIALTVGTAVYAWSRHRLAQAMKLQAVRNAIAGDLHDEVGSSLSSITIGVQLAKQMAPEGHERLRTLLDRIGETSSTSLRSMSDIVWAIDPKNDEGEALVKRLRRTAGELLEGKSIAVSFQVGPGVEELRLPMGARKEIVLLFKEALHNTSKHSDARTVQVTLQRSDRSLALTVADDGRGFDLGLHAEGHGLGSMRRRADLLGAKLELTSGPGSGTSVSLDIPLAAIQA